MSTRELVRYRVLSLVLEGQLQDAAEKLGLSPRHARRLLRRLHQRGPAGLIHGNRGRPAANRTPPELRQKILASVEGPYAGFNDTHLTEMLAERQGVRIGRETLRSLLRKAGYRPKRRRRPQKHHRRRARSPNKGLMLLWDGSPHRWLGPDHPPLTLMAALDDADGELVAAFFALSPQAKGRIERLFGVLQDRLLAEMKLDSITTLEEANRYLKTTCIRRYNRRFRKKPQSSQSAYRSTRGFDLHKHLALRYQATVLNDNSVRLGGLTIDIPPGPRGRSWAKARVDIHQHLYGSWSLYYQDHTIAQAPASPLAETLRYRKHLPPQQRTKAAHQELLVYLPNPQLPRTLSLGT